MRLLLVLSRAEAMKVTMNIGLPRLRSKKSKDQFGEEVASKCETRISFMK